MKGISSAHDPFHPALKILEHRLLGSHGFHGLVVDVTSTRKHKLKRCRDKIDNRQALAIYPFRKIRIVMNQRLQGSPLLLGDTCIEAAVKARVIPMPSADVEEHHRLPFASALNTESMTGTRMSSSEQATVLLAKAPLPSSRSVLS
ncbi:hypothetical protein [Herbaspirillum sp. YR522]|uniref:hypothetical protein n=1 Tax=Herbaspirillum sp. YR522 TaxID=1144342 RepID=UPI0012F98594|nr:hypothetical protein [Herbaspirillum sp. YR522]